MIAQLNQTSQAEFTAALGEIWEEAPQIAEKFGIADLLKI